MGHLLKNLSEAKKYMKGYKKPFNVLYVLANGDIYQSKQIAELRSEKKGLELFTVKKAKNGGTK